MPKGHQPRSGSLQYWPRKRAQKLLPSVNWDNLQKRNPDKKGLLGFICYKAGMARLYVKDNTPNSLTKGKKIILPISVVECPPMKILSVRLYKRTLDGKKVVKDILGENLDKELKKRIKLPKEKRKFELKEEPEELTILVYPIVKKTGKKKKPEILEIGIGGTIQEKVEFVKKNIDKELNFKDYFEPAHSLDIKGVTKGHGFTGPVKRFGISLKSHKSEKGVRRPGSLGPWKPHRVTFRTPLAGQFGFFTRIGYNKKLLGVGENLELIFKNYGKVKTSYAMIKGSVHGPAKRALVLTIPARETRRIQKRTYEIIKVLK
ncbi:MAG: 50S ribosomal protein L3 [archaeon]